MNESLYNHNRKDWIDALRAMAMLFVVFGHQAQWCDMFFLYTTPIKIPLFFTLSGYLFNYRNGNQLHFYKGWFRKLVLPFFCLVTIPALFISFNYGIEALLGSWSKMISGESYWFITCLIVAEIIHFYIVKISRNTLWVISACLVCAIIGFLLNKYDFCNYAKVNTALISQCYLLIGYLIRKYEEKLDLLNNWIVLGCVAFYFLLCYFSQFLFSYNYFDCNQNQYYNIPYCMLLAVLGCCSSFLVAKRCIRIPRWLIYVGQNTFILYIWGGYALLLFVLFSKMGVQIPRESLLVCIIQTIWVTIACMAAAYVINRHLPFVVGKKH